MQRFDSDNLPDALNPTLLRIGIGSCTALDRFTPSTNVQVSSFEIHELFKSLNLFRDEGCPNKRMHIF